VIATEVNEALIAQWAHSRYPYKQIAAAITEWALTQERGADLPANEFFAGDLGVVASGSTWKRAKNFLATVGVLHHGDGPYQVA
jgi:hypothetical protein